MWSGRPVLDEGGGLVDVRLRRPRRRAVTHSSPCGRSATGPSAVTSAMCALISPIDRRHDLAAVAEVHLVAVVGGRVVAGGDHHAGRAAEVPDGEGQHGRRQVRRQHHDADARRRTGSGRSRGRRGRSRAGRRGRRRPRRRRARSGTGRGRPRRGPPPPGSCGSGPGRPGRAGPRCRTRACRRRRPRARPAPRRCPPRPRRRSLPAGRACARPDRRRSTHVPGR